MNDIHLAIYDKKNAGIVSAAIHLNPNKVILLHRKEHDIEGVKSVLSARGIKCEGQMISFEPSQIRNILGHIFKKNKDTNLTFNASSGYRMMVLVTLEQFTQNGLQSFIVDKFTNNIHWLHSKDNSSVFLKCELKIKEYLRFFSAQVLSAGEQNRDSSSLQDLTHWLVKNINEFGSSLAAMNHIAMKADYSMKYRMDNRYSKKKYLREILRRFEEVGILRMESDTVYFKDEKSRFYANGGWLENHVFNTLHNIKSKRSCISDLARGMEISRAQGKVTNEVDVIAMANNRLHLIECKTRKFTNKHHANTPGAAAIYRLDTLKDLLGGNSGKGMLVSYQKLSKYTEQRALDLGIKCCSHNQLKNLQDHLYKFIDSEK